MATVPPWPPASTVAGFTGTAGGPEHGRSSARCPDLPLEHDRLPPSCAAQPGWRQACRSRSKPPSAGGCGSQTAALLAKGRDVHAEGGTCRCAMKCPVDPTKLLCGGDSCPEGSCFQTSVQGADD